MHRRTVHALPPSIAPPRSTDRRDGATRAIRPSTGKTTTAHMSHVFPLAILCLLTFGAWLPTAQADPPEDGAVQFSACVGAWFEGGPVRPYVYTDPSRMIGAALLVTDPQQGFYGVFVAPSNCRTP